MPKAFNSDQLNYIRTKLLNIGKNMFEQQGFNNFGIRDLVKEAGISIGMFYKFFNSKEDFFMKIVNIEKQRIRKSIVKEVMQFKEEPVKALKSFYYIVVKELYDNPLMKTILFNEEYSAVKEQLSETDLISDREQSLQPFLDLMNYWKSKNLILDVNNELVLGSLRSLVYLNFHKDEIGLDKFDSIIEFLINQVCGYLEGDFNNT